MTRIIFSFMALTLFFYVFTGDDSLPGIVRDTLLSIQFIPSLMSLKSHPGLSAGAGFLFIVVTGMVFGRVYCSFLCPLGILQDIFIRLSWLLGIKKTHAFQKSYPRIRYGIAVVTMITLFLGSMDLIGLLDPLSLFGRTTTHLFKPAFLGIQNMTASVLETFDIYMLSVKKPHFVSRPVYIVTFFSFTAVLFFSLFYGRLYCNTICPAGALIGLFSNRSLFSFSLNRSTCVSCGACERACKAGCIDINRKTIDLSRCISCFNCFDVCDNKAITYEIVTKGRSINVFSPVVCLPSRRYLLTGSLSAGASIIFCINPLTLLSKTGSRETIPVLPAGSVSVSRFRANCLGCHLCVSVCPTNVITPGASPSFFSGFFMPEMDFNRGFCDITCHACGHACPNDAIRAMPFNLKKEVRMGLAVLHKDLCIVHVKKKHCGACGEACPTRAVSPVEKGRVLFPELNPDYCIGCGACVYACPAKPKAIYVKGLGTHEKAKNYQSIKRLSLPLPAKTSDFPF